MKRKVIILTILTSCSADTLLTPSPEPITTVKIETVLNYTDHDIAEYERYLHDIKVTLEKVINSQQFHREVLRAKLIHTNDLSNEEIYQVIKSGHEVLGAPDRVLNLKIKMAYMSYNGIASTDRETGIITLNLHKWGRNFNSNLNTLLHEWLHTAGFMHYKSIEPDAVPYKVGLIAEKLL